jgi:prepilin-type N-terminal cleavage/methylation domain-containing protein
MNKQLQRPALAGGFTLIEVLIASAIMTTSMGVLLQLFSSSISRMIRAGEIAHNLLIEQQIMQELAILNPVQKNQGDSVIAGKKMHWQATLKKEPQTMPLTQGEFGTEKFAGLYEITVSFNDANGKPLSLHWEQLGWK